ncbi:bZIP tanscription factor [Nitzschia inconspicua]|uniref:BZIP tanscription factor n=1 Tax=Nitzschia inconspicua TaxID=303405 RepID=A0A9K3PYE0_9STRA|nr:bZIP tanscription factor [Nitzschia inconspicua]
MNDSRNPPADSGQGASSNRNGSIGTPVLSNPLAVVLAGSHHQPQQGFSHVDPNTALMMSNAAATIAAVAAQAMQQMAGQQQQQQQRPPSGFPASLYAALQGGNSSNPLLSASAASTHAPPAHAALLAALSGSAHQAPPLSGLLSGNNDTAAPALLRSMGALLQQQNPSVPVTSPSALSNMQSWNVEKLEQHVALLQQTNQAIPQPVSLLLSEAQRKEKKKNAKRVANRKSASTSRARKKALVEEMTQTNARLKRQALILSLLPDLVITTTPEGEITFCSAQVERILQYKAETLLGANLSELLVPSSREALKCLMEELTHPGKAKAARASAVAQVRRGSKRRLSDQRVSRDETGTSKVTEGNANGNSNGSSRVSAGSGAPSTQATSTGVAVVSDKSFPLSVVEVESKKRGKSPKPNASNEKLETSASNRGGENGSRAADTERENCETKQRPRSDDSSSFSSDAKNLRAGDTLDRNVRWHNQRMLHGSNVATTDDGPKDDVTGASVTANNAGARLSSLKHVPEMAVEPIKDEKDLRYENAGDQSSSDDSLLAGVEEKKKGESASDDSGYRESNDSREETSSSGSDTSQSNDRRKKYMASAIRLCLIRDDLTTVWCEVTSSIRDRAQDEEDSEEKITSKCSDSNDTTVSKPEQKELLLCLRPTRDGEKAVDKSLRFCPYVRNDTLPPRQSHQYPTETSSNADVTGTASSGNSNKHSNRPPKKRTLTGSSVDSSSIPEEAPPHKRSKGQTSTNDTEKSVVESLLKMNKSSQ